MAGGWNAGSIVSKLELSKSKWDASVKTVKGNLKTLGGQVQANSAKFKSMGRGMTVAGGAIVASMGLMISKYAQAGDEVHKMAIKTGFSTQALSELKYAAEISGGSLTSLDKGIKKMSKSLTDASIGLETYVRSFDRIGLSVEELMALSPEDQFMKIAEGIASLESPTLRAATAQEIFGRAGTELLPLFAEGADGMADLRDKAKELGYSFDQEAANGAARLVDAQTTLKTAMSGLGISISQNLAPALSKLIEGLSDTIGKITDWIKEHPKLTEIIAKAVLGIGALMTALGPLMMMLPGLVVIIPKIGLAIKALLGPWGLLAAAIALITVKAIAAIGTFKEFKESLEGYIDASGEKMSGFETAWASLTATIHKHVYGVDAAKFATQKYAEMTDEARKKQADHAIKVLDSMKKMKGLTGALKTAKGVYGTVTGAIGGLIGKTDDAGESSTTWAEILKTQGIPSLGEYTKKIDDLKDKKKLLKKALDEGEISLATYKSEIKSVDGELSTLTGTTKKVTKETKTWVDYLADMGLKTVEEKTDRVEELEGYIDDLSQAYKDGEIDLEAYTNALNIAKGEIKDLSTSISTTAIPAFRDMSGVLDSAVGEMTDRIPDITTKVKEETVKTKSIWDTMADGLQTKWASALGEILRGATSFKDGLKGVWDAIVVQFTDMIGQMIAKWMAGFIGKILTSLTSKFVPGVEDAMGDAASSAAGASTSIGASMATAFNVGIIVAWAAAAWSVISGWGDQMNIFWEEQRGLIDDYIDSLKKLGRTWREIKDILGEKEYVSPRPRPPIEDDKIPGKGGGIGGRWGTGFEGIIDQPTLALIGESGPEAVSVRPLSQGQPSAPSNLTVNNNVILNGTVITDRDYARKRMIPEMLSALEANFEKTKMKQILGIA